MDRRALDRPRHGARAALGLAQHLHLHQVAGRPGAGLAERRPLGAGTAVGGRVGAALSLQRLERGLHHQRAAHLPGPQGPPDLPVAQEGAPRRGAGRSRRGGHHRRDGSRNRRRRAQGLPRRHQRLVAAAGAARRRAHRALCPQALARPRDRQQAVEPPARPLRGDAGVEDPLQRAVGAGAARGRGLAVTLHRLGAAALGHASPGRARRRRQGQAARDRDAGRPHRRRLPALHALHPRQPLRVSRRPDAGAVRRDGRGGSGAPALGSRDHRVAALLARAAHAGPQALGLPQPRGGVPAQAEEHLHLQGPPRALHRHHQAAPFAHGVPHPAPARLRRAGRALHLQAGRRAGAPGGRGAGRARPRARRSRRHRVGEPARVGHRLLRHPGRRRRRRSRRRQRHARRDRERGADGAGRSDPGLGAGGAAARRPEPPRRRRLARRGSGGGAAGASGARDQRQGRRHRLADLHLGHDRDAQGRHALAQELHLAPVQARRRLRPEAARPHALGPAAAPHLRVHRRVPHAVHARRAGDLSRRHHARGSGGGVRGGRRHRHDRRAGAVPAPAPEDPQGRRRQGALGLGALRRRRRGGAPLPRQDRLERRQARLLAGAEAARRCRPRS